ncbi:hypothetical protein ACOCEA_17690 [Maribacter sp. CXY002]|uniref:hypothetical protein n=1 Tax=Maribacter luteocoastalis TaxID=3407671 RepID=UPI003B670807
MGDEHNKKDVDFLKNGPWDELYVLSQHWVSDLGFYRDDLHFLHHLIDKYFMWIIKTENIKMVRELKKGLLDLNTKSKDLLEKVGKHLVQLGYLVEDPTLKDAGIIRMEHEHLEDEIAAFVKSFRENRREVFKTTEFIMDNEKLSNIMES